MLHYVHNMSVNYIHDLVSKLFLAISMHTVHAGLVVVRRWCRTAVETGPVFAGHGNDCIGKDRVWHHHERTSADCDAEQGEIYL